MNLTKVEESSEKKVIDRLLAIAPVSLGTVASLARDMKMSKRAVQVVIQVGFERGWWTLNEELFLKTP